MIDILYCTHNILLIILIDKNCCIFFLHNWIKFIFFTFSKWNNYEPVLSLYRLCHLFMWTNTKKKVNEPSNTLNNCMNLLIVYITKQQKLCSIKNYQHKNSLWNRLVNKFQWGYELHASNRALRDTFFSALWLND